jgi:micrococcal nuclease
VRRWFVPLVVVALLGGAAFYCAGDDATVETETGDTSETTEGQGDMATAKRVHDGDSFLVRLDTGEEVDVRLIGINAPDQFECLHHEARRTLAGYLGDGAFSLESDVTDRDRFGRLLRYVRSGDVLVNVAMVEQGLALLTSSGDDVAHLAELQAAQARARAAGLGVWRPDACGPPAATTVRITHVESDPPGRDDQNVNGEYAVISNGGDMPVDMTKWKLRDNSTQNRFWFPDGFVLGPGRQVTVHVGSGDDTGDTLFWGRRYPVWDNAGDVAILLDPKGNFVSIVDIQAS